MERNQPLSPLSIENPRPKDRQVEIAQCLRELHSRNPHVRRQAVKRLGELRAEPGALIAMLEDNNSYVRSTAAEALGNAAGSRREDVIERLMAAIDDPNDYVCTAAISSLGVLRAEAAREQILDCLSDDNPYVVQAAIIALARIGPPSLAERLADFLESDNYLVRLAAARAVGLLEYKPAGLKVLENLRENIVQHNERDIKLPKNYIQTLAKLKVVEAIPILMEVAQNIVGLRSVAVEALIDLKADAAAPVLAPLLSDPSNNLRRSLIEMMINADYRASLPLIRTLLKDPAVTIREEALAAVNHWHDQASVEQVRWMAYHDPNPFVRPQAVTALVDLIGRDALPDLIALASDHNPHVREAVANNLGKLGRLPEEGLAALQELVRDEHAADAARNALIAHGLAIEQMPVPIKPPPPAEALVPTDPEEVRTLLEGLERWQSSLGERLDPRTAEDRVILDQALTTLIAALRKYLRQTS